MPRLAVLIEEAAASLEIRVEARGQGDASPGPLFNPEPK
jgi:hypothetical protein